MRVTILIEDNAVYVDGVYAPVDCTALRHGEICVVQWRDDWGEEEFYSVEENQILTRKPNNRITDFSPYQSYADAWEVSRAALVAEEEAVQREMTDKWNQALERQAEIDAALEAAQNAPPPPTPMLTLEQYIAQVVQEELKKHGTA